MAFVVNKFRHNVVRLQHICIAYNACTSARMELLHLKWEEIERKVTMQVVEERHAASLLFAGRLRDLDNCDRLELSLLERGRPG